MKFSNFAFNVAVFAAIPDLSVRGYTVTHTFSIDDVMGGFDGSTFGDSGARQDKSILCDAPGGEPPEGAECPPSLVDKQGVTLYPIDSEFGFDVTDFLGAQEKTRDNDYLEGYAGNINDGPDIIGLKVSNSATNTYKVKPPLGTWCQGLGSNTVKCSSEHYSVMEHLLTCYETIPYFFADPVTGEQDCDAQLDNEIFVIQDGEVSDQTYPGDTPIEPNDNTDVHNNIATSTDFSVTLKDDGKALYRWGSLIKRPTDIRLYARLELPEEWKVEGAPDYTVTKAHLIVEHWVTNNPNDQLRAEDLENEAATGRKPDYYVETALEKEFWLSRYDCYEGDGDFIEGEEDGTGEPTPLPAGTVLKNGKFTSDDPVFDGLDLSSDLREGFTNAYYTTIDREPFEWSYRKTDTDETVHEFVGFPEPLTVAEAALQDLELVSGPRWRLKASKFGQDLPGLEIPAQPCVPPPYEKDKLKYQVGEPVTTIINLLDWDEEEKGPSPLSTSKGWVDVTANEFVNVSQVVDGTPVTTNGLPMTNDFDLAVYIKGDKKPTAIFTAKLEIDYEGEVDEQPNEADVAVENASFEPELPTIDNQDITVSWDVKNYGPQSSIGSTRVSCKNLKTQEEFNSGNPPFQYGDLEAGDSQSFSYTFNPEVDSVTNFKCTVRADPFTASPPDPNLDNNKITDLRIKIKNS